MTTLSQDCFLNDKHSFFYLDSQTEPPSPEPPAIPLPPVPPPPAIPEPPTNTPGNFGIGGTLLVGAFSQNLISGEPRVAGSNGQLEIVSIIDNTYNCWNEIVGTQTYAGSVANQTNSAVWIAGTRDSGGIEVISGASTTGNTYNTQVNMTADVTVAGTLTCGSIIIDHTVAPPITIQIVNAGVPIPGVTLGPSGIGNNLLSINMATLIPNSVKLASYRVHLSGSATNIWSGWSNTSSGAGSVGAYQSQFQGVSGFAFSLDYKGAVSPQVITIGAGGGAIANYPDNCIVTPANLTGNMLYYCATASNGATIGANGTNTNIWLTFIPMF